MFEQLAPELSFGARLPLANLWLFEPLVVRVLMRNPQSAALLHTTVAPTVLRAGEKANQLPARATAVVNLRLRPGDSVRAATDVVRRVVDDPRVRVSVIGEGTEPSAVSDTRSPAYTTLARSIREVLPADTVLAPSLVIATTDSRRYAATSPNVFRFLPMVVTPADITRPHGINERLSVADLATSIRFYYRLLQNAERM
jgi:carboxypeptidase PM20D1